MAAGTIAFALLLCTAAAAAAIVLVRRPGAPALIACAYALLALSLAGQTVWNHVGNAQRTSTELFVWLAVAAVTWPPTRRATIWIAAGALLCGAFLLFGSYDAATVRDALWVLGPES